MAPSSIRRGFTLTEMIVTVLIVTFLMGYAWKIYFGGREAMRHTVSQSQMQQEARLFMDRLSRDVSAAYRFFSVNPEEKKFGFYSFQLTRTPTDEIFYDTLRGGFKRPDDQALLVMKVEYVWKENGTVTRFQTPGNLKFLRTPMVFEEGNPTQYEKTEFAKAEKVVLHNISDFEFRPYLQVFKRNTANPTEPPKVEVLPVVPTDPKKAAQTTFISLRIHNKIDEKGDRRDEELDLVAKFYSRVRLAEAAYPGYFSSTDEYRTF